jgi:hypothetical protein
LSDLDDSDSSARWPITEVSDIRNIVLLVSTRSYSNLEIRSVGREPLPQIPAHAVTSPHPHVTIFVHQGDERFQGRADSRWLTLAGSLSRFPRPALETTMLHLLLSIFGTNAPPPSRPATHLRARQVSSDWRVAHSNNAPATRPLGSQLCGDAVS